MAGSSLSQESLNEYIGGKLLGAGISMLVIITMVYILFNISRFRFAEKNYWEVWTIYPAAYLASMAICLSDIGQSLFVPQPARLTLTESRFIPVMVKIAGGGHHMVYLAKNDPDAIVKWLKIQTADEIIYMTAVTLPRIAICILYLRIFTQRTVRILTWVTLTNCILHWFGAGILAQILICQPYAYRWDSSIKGGWCGDLVAGYKFVSVPNLVIDVALIALPFSSLYRLQISWPRKIGIFITFMAGCL